jgi:DNA-binding response OmpR family regulator
VKSKILYVEDEAVLAKIVQEGLERLSFDVCHASNGEEGLVMFEQFQPDLCLLDVMMPKMDGFTLGKMIKTKRPHVPILYLTAKSTTEDVVEGFSSGGNDYLRKPFSMQELNVRMNNLLSLSHPKRSGQEFSKGIISVGNYTYFPDKQILNRGNVTANLSFREHELLMNLLNSKQQIVKRRQLLKDIWGDDSFFNSRNLDVYIRKLRTYFAEDENVQIITLKGVGYKFVF